MIRAAMSEYVIIGWTFQGVTVNNCQVAFNLTTGGLTPATQVSYLDLVI